LELDESVYVGEFQGTDEIPFLGRARAIYRTLVKAHEVT
jgi:hypothetical protein